MEARRQAASTLAAVTDLQGHSAGHADAVVFGGVHFPRGRAGIRSQVLLQDMVWHTEQPLRRPLHIRQPMFS